MYLNNPYRKKCMGMGRREVRKSWRGKDLAQGVPKGRGRH